MSLRLPGQWVWDSWYTFDGVYHHAFYLQASRALGDPDRRHRNPSIGHSISTDLRNWTVVADAIAIGEEPAFDDYTTWTGSVVQDEAGLWWMFYTGSSRHNQNGLVQSIGAATSPDLLTWTKLGSEALVSADGRWYEKLGSSDWPDEAWRDPWVFKLPNDSRWHMLITARSNQGPLQGRGVIGHAVSENLRNWQVEPPLSAPGQGFGQNEVFQYAEVDGVSLLIWCCGWREYDEGTLARIGKKNGVWSTVVSPDLSNVDFTNSQLFEDTSLYAGRVVKHTDGNWYLLAFLNDVDGKFVGEICDPIAVTADPVLGLVAKR
jgi:beta-fructofuranosidase